ncbi:MAG TPA: RlmI/RlmK family 23S rRNA methyltransferase [Saprospirales bacterium]|nr:RlmI/RlmK family 23S rRNA methyltransferase [Saprospirales bacterium]HRQ29402.1 class I SAM-dependent rRNA methyltransferase [Saprospiraceae bacterium]
MTLKQKPSDQYPSLSLNKGRDQSILRKHPWIFSGAIRSTSGKLHEGEIAEVFDYEGNYLASGFVENGSIAAKIFTFERTVINIDFWVEKLSAAWVLRQKTGLTESEQTNAWRLVFAEGDGLPGLILDYYNGLVVFLAQSLGMYKARFDIVRALKICLKEKLTAVYDKSVFTKKQEGTQDQHFLTETNAENPVMIKENGYSFLVDFMYGQKTGFFLDQRDNRYLVGKYSKGKKVLNLFSYTGGFSVYALKNDASAVYSVDSSSTAIELAAKNVALNCPEIADRHYGVIADVKDYLQQMESDFDLIILDPPAFAKHRESRHKAILGYKYLNSAAIKRIRKGGILFTFSCSQLVTADLFESMILSAGIESGRNVRVIHRLSQPADHPFSIFHPEGNYLKGLVLYVE